MSASVAIVRCPSYEPSALKDAVSTALTHIGSLAAVVKPSRRVLLKINHLGSHPPETAIDTHPAFLRAVVELVREVTDDVVVADGLDQPGLDEFETSGTLAVCRELDVELLNLKGAGYREVRKPGFETVAGVPIAEAALDADVVISLPKLKTHMLCLMTNAVKNNYGFVPRKLRNNYHRMFAHPDRFSNLVVDIFEARPPDLVVVDAVVALEGTGPSRGGRPKKLGLVLAGRDAVAVDAVSAAIMGLKPMDVASTRHAARRGLGEADLAKIAVLGESIAAARSPFDLPANRMLIESMLQRMPKPVLRLLGGLARSMRELPCVVDERCVACGLCVRHCPQGAVKIVDGKARIDYGKCIACFCCQEFCDAGAVAVRRTGIGRLAGLAEGLRRRLRRTGRKRP